MNTSLGTFRSSGRLSLALAAEGNLYASQRVATLYCKRRAVRQHSNPIATGSMRMSRSPGGDAELALCAQQWCVGAMMT